MVIDLNENELATLAELLVKNRREKGDKSVEGESLEAKLTVALLKEAGYISRSFAIQTKAAGSRTLVDEENPARR